MTSAPAPAPPPPARCRQRRPAGRWEATGIAFVWILLFGPVLAVWVVSIVAIPLVLVTAGIVLLLVAVPLMGASSPTCTDGWPRGCSAEDVPASYVSTDGEGVLGKLQVWMRDPARWRDLLWGLVDITAGFVLVRAGAGAAARLRVVAGVPARLRRDPRRRVRHAARLHDHRHVLGVVLRVDRRGRDGAAAGGSSRRSSSGPRPGWTPTC